METRKSGVVIAPDGKRNWWSYFAIKENTKNDDLKSVIIMDNLNCAFFISSLSCCD